MSKARAAMAVDITSVCTLASENQSSQDLAIWLSVLFSIYTVISIALSALTIYTSSQVGPPGAKEGKPTLTGAFAGDGLGDVPLVAFGGVR